MSAALTVEMYLNNGQFYIGSTDWPALELKVGFDAAIAANDTHLLLRAVSQSMPVRVSVSTGHSAAPRGHLIYDGMLSLPDGKLYVGTHHLGGPYAILPIGFSYRVLVYADEVGREASRFAVVLDPEHVPDDQDLRRWPPAPTMKSAPRDNPATDLGVWLDGHDRARLRLQQAYRIVQRGALEGHLDAAACAVPVKDLVGDIRKARIGTDFLLRGMVKPWLRLLDPDVTEALAHAAVDSARDVLVKHLATQETTDVVATRMVEATDGVLGRGLGYHVLLWKVWQESGHGEGEMTDH
ncbi:MAG: hypothetical protein HOW97_21120 [Catenulispora sp.]|nr:hypothetical protein [Catenulispora sp.]